MNVLDYLVNSLMTVVLIVGSYQFYFFLQRQHVRKPIEFSSRIDELIPFRPGWVWVYTALYYPVILLGVLTRFLCTIQLHSIYLHRALSNATASILHLP